MRKDMTKVVTDRPRNCGDGDGAKKIQKKDWESAPSYEGMIKPHRRCWSGKEQNPHVSPLKRFIESRVGKKWDDVFSEICEQFKSSSSVQLRFRSYIDWFVETNISIGKNGEFYDGGHKFDPENCYRGMWVDPTDGILKRCRRKKVESWSEQQKIEKSLTECVLKDGSVARKKNGVWYQCVIDSIPPYTCTIHHRFDGTEYYMHHGGHAYDVILEKTVYFANSPHTRLHGRLNHAIDYVKAKRQLSHDELKKNGIEND